MDNLEPLTRRMDAVEEAVRQSRMESSRENGRIMDAVKDVSEAVQDVSERLGNPTNGPNKPATGLYWRVETMAGELSPFKMWAERAKGMLLFVPPVAVLFWFTNGDKLTKLFHG